MHLSLLIKSLRIVYLSGAIKSSGSYPERIFPGDIVKAEEYDYPFVEREVGAEMERSNVTMLAQPLLSPKQIES